jgi:hypothetical protein
MFFASSVIKLSPSGVRTRAALTRPGSAIFAPTGLQKFARRRADAERAVFVTNTRAISEGRAAVRLGETDAMNGDFFLHQTVM